MKLTKKRTKKARLHFRNTQQKIMKADRKTLPHLDSDAMHLI
jgi:hypothetical protein